MRGGPPTPHLAHPPHETAPSRQLSEMRKRRAHRHPNRPGEKCARHLEPQISGQCCPGYLVRTTPKCHGGSSSIGPAARPAAAAQRQIWAWRGRTAITGPRGVGRSDRQWITNSRPPDRTIRAASATSICGSGKCRMLKSRQASQNPSGRPNPSAMTSRVSGGANVVRSWRLENDHGGKRNWSGEEAA